MLLRQPFVPAARLADGPITDHIQSKLKQRFGGSFVTALLLLVSAIIAPAHAQQNQNQLQFENNFLVTGDYVVAGAYGMTSFSNGIATGKITVPDTNNKGIQGANYVPPGAQVVSAVLYWATVEKSGTVPGQQGSGQNGFFRPLVNGGLAAPGYAISGVLLGTDTSVAYNNGACSTPSDGKVTRVYRADVRGLLPVDANGNVASGTSAAPQSYEVRFPSVGNSAPLTLGATLVIVYRVLDPQANPLVPLNAISIYDGAFGSTTPIPTPLNQTIKGFYQADGGITRFTAIVASGTSAKYQTGSLNTVHNSLALTSLYGNNQPLFPGWYGAWDNPTWTFNGNVDPISANDDSITAIIGPSASKAGCVTWGAIIFSATVKDPDHDGILPVWKQNQGYTDVKTGQHVSLADPTDPPVTGRRDMYIQLDHVVDDLGKSYAPDPAAVDMVKQAFAAKNIHLHINTTQRPAAASEILEATCTDQGTTPDKMCAFPNQQGVTTWRGGFNAIKNQLIDANGHADTCAVSSPPAGCVSRFNPAQKDSFHHVIFGGLLGAANWTFADGSLFGVTASGNKVTFTTTLAHGMPSPKFADPSCASNARVTIVDAITNPSLNGTYCVDSILNANQFTIKIAKATSANYTRATDPNFALAFGYAGNRSGDSDLGGAGSLITLGGWSADANNINVQAGTLMHELGHSIGLPHGGAYYSPGSFVATYEPNCKPNYQSVMNYNFQVDLLDMIVNGKIVGGFLDYSGQVLDPLNESKLGTNNVISLTPAPTYATTWWYAPAMTLETGTKASRYCDGSPLPANAPAMYLHSGPATNISWTDGNLIYKFQNNQDVDFNGTSDVALHGFNDWANIDLRQIGATGSAYTVGGGFPQGGGGFPQGGGGFPQGGGGFPQGGGGFPQGGGGFPQGGGGFPQGGGNRAGDISHDTANAVTRPPRNLAATEDVSPRVIHLTWDTPSFGTIGQYNIYRSDAGGAFHIIHSNAGTPPATAYDDNVSCVAGGYKYFVTAVLDGTTQESVPSNPVSVPNGTDPLTGCYTITAFTAPASSIHGSIVPVTWTLKDDFYTPAKAVTNLAATRTLIATGPVSSDNCATVTTGQTTLISNGAVTAFTGGVSSYTVDVNGKFTFNWDTDTAPFCAGTYTFALTLDSNQVPLPQPTTVLSIDIQDTDSTPHITTVSIPGGTVGKAYSYQVTEHGGTPPLSWNTAPNPPVSGIPIGLMSGILGGTTCAASGTYNFTASVTDAKGNAGSQGLSLAISKADTTTTVASSTNPSVFQQPVTLTVNVAPQYSCTPTGTVTLYDGAVTIGSQTLSGGSASFTIPTTPGGTALAVGNHSFTAVYSGDGSFNGSNSNSTPLMQTVNKASTTTAITTVTPPPPNFVGQPITVSWTFGVVSPGGASPIAPSGNITVMASDGSGCNAPPTTGSCTLLPVPTTPGPRTFTVTYPGDGNFVTSGANSPNPGYNVYRLAFTAQPSNTTASSTITPPIKVAAQDNLGNTLTSFTGNISLALGNNPSGASLSGTTQNVAAVAGVASFSGLSIDKTGTGYTLVASTGTPASSATSNAFDVITILSGDLVVVDGNPAANPPQGTVVRLTQDGASSNTLATITDGQPTSVAVDSTTGSIYVAVSATGNGGTSRLVKIDHYGSVTDPFNVSNSNYSLVSPAGIAVDSSGNVYVGEIGAGPTNGNIYKFTTAGVQVDGSGNQNNGTPFATLQDGANGVKHIRMAFDSQGNLIVGSDYIANSVSVAEVESIASGSNTLLYNTTANSTVTPPIRSVGGLTLLADGSVDIADYAAKVIYNLNFSGPTITAAVVPANFTSLCCDMTGLVNPANANGALFVTVQNAARVLKAVSPHSVTTVRSGSPFTYPNDIAWYKTRSTYYVDGNGNFGTLDLVTGAANVVGAGTLPAATGLDLVPGAPVKVYQFDVSGKLSQINLSNGTPTLLGGNGVIPHPEWTTTGGLADGSYFGVDISDAKLYSISLTDGSAAFVAQTTTPPKPATCGFETSLAGSGTSASGVLYYTVGIRGANCPVGQTIPDTLYTVNPLTGAASVGVPVINTSAGNTNLNGIVGSGFVGGKLYVFTFTGQEYVVDVTTGNATLVANTGKSIFGAASATGSIF